MRVVERLPSFLWEDLCRFGNISIVSVAYHSKKNISSITTNLMRNIMGVVRLNAREGLITGITMKDVSGHG